MDPLAFFITFLRDAALSVGGLSSLPMLRQDLVAPGLVTEKQVIEALAIGRLSTGPTGLFTISLGYFAAGWPGAAVSLVAITLPPLTIVPLAAAVRHLLLSPWAAGIVRGIALSTSGLLVATGLQLVAPDVPIFSVPLWQVALAVVAGVLTIQGRVHPGLLVLAGALIGAAIGVAGGVPL
ncbi:MAG: chromate transporter [Chloroflexota bacterium]|nr:chromate transporter [Chloroflexota bacterium]MDE3192664.1 chromate transporter [Chloroflexota bacterium]